MRLTLARNSFTDAKKKAGAKPEKKDRNIMNLKVVVKSVSVHVKIRNGCSLFVEIADLVMQSTNGKWEVVDLAVSTTIEKEKSRELLYKQIKARSISVLLEGVPDASGAPAKRQYLLQDLPLTVQLVSAYSLDDYMSHISLNIDVYLEVICLRGRLIFYSFFYIFFCLLLIFEFFYLFL